MDLIRRTKTTTAAKEIKASANYGYITGGITLDGSKFALGELLLEGQCLVKDDASGKYEKYADAATLNQPAVLIGGAAINNAALVGIHADTVLTVTINGKVFTVSNGVLAALAADSTDDVILAALSGAVAADGKVAKDFADFSLVASKIHISTPDVGAAQSIAITGTWGAAADEAAVEGVFGVSLPASATGTTGVFPAGKSNPVILDESIQFELNDDGANPDVTAGQVLVWGAVYESMLIGVTATFKASVAGAIRFIS